MTDQEKLNKIKDILQGYADNEAVFAQPTSETAQQRQFREDLHTIVSMVFQEERKLSAEMSAAEIKAQMQAAWKQTKPKEWE